MSTQVEDDVEIDPLTSQPRLSHLVPPFEGRDGHVRIMIARLAGGVVTALCGHQFIPSLDPERFPTCDRCTEIFAVNTGGARDGWRDA